MRVGVRGQEGGLLTYGVVDQEPGDHYGKKMLERSDRVKMREHRGLKNNKAVALVSDAECQSFGGVDLLSATRYDLVKVHHTHCSCRQR